MASRAQAEMKMESAARHMQRAFDGLADDTARDVPPPGDADSDGARGDDAASASAAASVFVPPGGAHAGRSADASIRRLLAIGVEALAAQTGDRAGPLRVGTIRAGYLSERNPGKFGGWTRRYFVLDGAGRFFVHGRGGRGASRDVSRDASRAQKLKNASKDREEKAGSRAASALRGIGAAFAGVARAAAPEPAPGAGFGRAPVEATLSDAEIASDLTVSCVKHGPDPGDRAAADRPFCFRVIAPTGSTTLQAESEEEASAWVSDLQGVIAELISMGPRNPGFPGNAPRETTTRRGDEKKGDKKHVALGANALGSSGDGGGGEPDPAEALARAKNKKKETGDVSADSVRAALASVPGNAQCADCGAPDPDWASLNLVVVVCHRCAGAHRHLGAHVSKVRSASLDLDAWTPPVLSLFASVGNDRANDFWEARRRDGTVAPKVLRLEAAIKEGKDERGFAGKEPEHPPPVAFDCAGDPEATLAAVTRKYVARAHVKPATATVASCVAASASLDVPALLERLVRSSMDQRDAERVARERREGLLAAVARGEEAAPVAALLLMHGARVDGDGDADGDGDGDGDEAVPPARLRLDVARRAREAGCPLDGSVFALLRAAAETQGVEF